MSQKNTITVLGRKNSINVMKVMWASAELGLSTKKIDVGGAFAFEHVPNYLELNPNGRVPTIQDGELTLWESNVIVRYLSETYGQGTLWPEGKARWEAEKWMDWQQTQLLPKLFIVFWQLVRTPPQQQDREAIEKARAETAALWPFLDAVLGGRPFVAGDRLTMGDIPVGCAVYRWYALEGIERPALPNLEAWYERLKEREGFRTHVMLPLT